MGTNYYRVPKSSDVVTKQQKLNLRMQEMDWWNPSNAYDKFRTIEDPTDEWSKMSPWDEFIQGMSVHLGKRSSGWKFCWNFNDNKYYVNKEELLDFIRNGRVVDEYSELQDTEEFIEMVLSWGEPDGQIADDEYFAKNERYHFLNTEKSYDKIIDGLRVSSSVDFS